jgi:DNA invertase Pin-like site-specific DNA recombinase
MQTPTGGTDTTRKLRAVGYCRTSSESQEGNTSIPDQKRDIGRCAEREGWTLRRIYTDEAKSGAKTEGRADFQRMMRDGLDRQFDVVVVFDVTRFGRDGLDVLTSAKTLSEFGVRVVDVKGSFDSADRNRILSNYVSAGVAEHERIEILRRTKRGKIAVARDKNAPSSSKRPFGRIWVRTGRKKSDGRWEIDPDKQRMIADVARRYLAGEPLPKLARQYGVNHANLHKTLTKRCGGK